MSYSTEQLEALRRALVTGERRVSFGDKTVEYRSVEELLAAMRTVEAELARAAGTRPTRQVRITTGKGFLNGFTAKALTRDSRRLPVLYVGSRIPWAGMHETGGTISGKMLIPLHGRVGRKAFKAQVAQLLRGGNAYFVKNAKGHVVLMAENIKEHDQPLRGFKRRYRKAEGIKRLKRGADIPIAVLVPKVTLKKRLDIARRVVGRVPRLARAIEQEIRVLDDR